VRKTKVEKKNNGFDGKVILLPLLDLQKQALKQANTSMSVPPLASYE